MRERARAQYRCEADGPVERLGGAFEGALEELQVERNERKKVLWKWLKAKVEGEQMPQRLKVTDSTFVCHSQKNRRLSRTGHHMPSGLTETLVRSQLCFCCYV